jgi:N-acetylglucosamine kinase-like BadF-type ATPase
MGVILGVDGGNSKTELVAATMEGETLAFVRGPGSNSHGIGADGVAAVISRLVARTPIDLPADHGVFYLCGADVPADIAELAKAVRRGGWVREAVVDNDTFALLRAGTDSARAVAVICGSGINCVGRTGDRVARYPSLGWETGDWGGGEMLGRDALFLAARGEDGRGAPTELTRIVRDHFAAPSVEATGIDVHYRRLPQQRLGELAPLVVAAAERGDDVARELVERLAGEIVLLVERAVRDLGLTELDVVLGGGMLRGGEGLLWDTVVAGLPDGARPVALRDPPVVGAALAALDAAGASEAAKARLREDLRDR